MENKIKTHIEKLVKKRLKESFDRELKKFKNMLGDPVDQKEEKQKKDSIRKSIKKKFDQKYEYITWFDKILSQNLSDSYFPSNQEENDLFQLLNLEILYKRTIKSACDDGHPVIKELLKDINIKEELICEYIEKIKSYNSEPLEFYLLFQEELEKANFRLDVICKTIDKLSGDAMHGTVVSHPAKMTNPECKYPKFYVFSSFKASDGFIRTGNSEALFDMHINAVNLKVFKFISLTYKQKTLLEYIKNKDTLPFIKLFDVTEDRAKKWVQNFSVCINNEDKRTNQYIKQVYFPVEKNEYHLLSLLSPSGLIFSLKVKIDIINDRSPTAYSGKMLRKINGFSANGYSTIPNLTVTRHGGEHPKNISGLNNRYQSYYLLQSLPPRIQKRNIRFPKHNFFSESFRTYEYREVFYALHKILKTEYNNKRIREGRDYRLQDLMDRILDKMWAVRSVCKNQYKPENSQLKIHQKIWLCNEYMQNREEESTWLDKLCGEIAGWTIRTYEKLLGKQAIKLGESERLHIFKIVNENREALR